MKKICKNCKKEFETSGPGSGARVYCSDDCRVAGYAERFKYKVRHTAEQRKQVKALTDEEKAERFSVRVQTVKGVVTLSKQERRAVKMIPAEGPEVIFIERFNPGIIDTRCPNSAVHTFKEIQ